MRYEYSAGAIIYRVNERRRQFLILKKKNGEADMPKGHIEKGETSEIAAKREIKEETGLDANFIRFFHRDTKYFFKRGKTIVLKKVRFFLSKANYQEVRISSEHAGYEWLTYPEAAGRIRHKNMLHLLAVADEYADKFELISNINDEYMALPQKHKDWGLSATLVPGEGPLDATSMLIGQAPGRNEDKDGRPFIGRSGRLLGNALKAAGIKREALYITSVVQFYPPENRIPSSKEIDLCLPFLHRQIEVITPKNVLLLGNVAAQAVLGLGTVEKNHGSVIDRNGCNYMVTFHPAAALRSTTTKALFEADIKSFASLVKKKRAEGRESGRDR